MPIVHLNDKSVNVLRALMASQKKKIQASFEITKKIEIGSINNFEVTQVHKHTGFGGTTFVVSANMSTVNHGMIPGGMVIKFPNNLEEEVENATALNLMCKKRQDQWDRVNHSNLHPIIKHLPSTIFAPAVIETVKIPNSDTSCFMLEFVDNAVPLVDSYEKGGIKEKLHILGYALARLHGPVSFPTKLDIYRPIFSHLSRSGVVDQSALDNWMAVLRDASGSVEVIHGDSHLLNVLKTGVNSVAWIDAMLVPDSDRMDDIGYALSYMIQKDVSENVANGVNPTEIVNLISENAYKIWAPSVLEAYNATVSLKTLYKYSPIDFFLGAHCIIRSDLWDNTNIKWCLNEIGKYFITQWPINKILGLA